MIPFANKEIVSDLESPAERKLRNRRVRLRVRAFPWINAAQPPASNPIHLVTRVQLAS